MKRLLATLALALALAAGAARAEIDLTSEEFTYGPYRRMLGAAATECLEQYGKAAAGHLKGVYAICRKNFEDPAADKWQTPGGYPFREALDDFYAVVLYYLNREGAIPAAVLKKEETRIAEKWGQTPEEIERRRHPAMSR